MTSWSGEMGLLFFSQERSGEKRAVGGGGDGGPGQGHQIYNHLGQERFGGGSWYAEMLKACMGCREW